MEEMKALFKAEWQRLVAEEKAEKERIWDEMMDDMIRELDEWYAKNKPGWGA
jgi:hypothetical protein